MGKIIVEVVNDSVIITEYTTKGFVIPDKISQVVEEVPVKLKGTKIKGKPVSELSPDMLAYTRGDFIMNLLSYDTVNVTRYRTFCQELYSEKDQKRGITWGEVAYLLYYVGGLERNYDWNEIKPDKDLRIGILKEEHNGEIKLDECLGHYRNSLSFDDYITKMRCGVRPIPLIMYNSFVNFVMAYGVDFGVNISMLFKKVSVVEIEKVLEEIVYVK